MRYILFSGRSWNLSDAMYSNASHLESLFLMYVSAMYFAWVYHDSDSNLNMNIELLGKPDRISHQSKLDSNKLKHPELPDLR